MGIGDVVAQLKEHRNAVQAASGFGVQGADSAKEAWEVVAEVLTGAENQYAHETRQAYARVTALFEELLATLAEADDLIAEYAGVVDSGGGSAGTKSTAVAKPSGEEIVKRTAEGQGQGRLDRFLKKAMTGAGDLKDAMDKPVEFNEKFMNLRAKERSPGAETVTYTGTAQPDPLAPPPPDVGDAVAQLGLIAVVGVQGVRMGIRRFRSRRDKERKDG